MYSCTSEGMFPWNNEKSLCPAFIEKQNKTKQKSTHSQFVQVGEAWNCTKLAFLRLTQTINVRSHQKLTTAGNVKVSYRGVGEVETRLLGSQGLWCLKSKWSCEKKVGNGVPKTFGERKGERDPLDSPTVCSWPDTREGSLPSKGLNVNVTAAWSRCSWSRASGLWEDQRTPCRTGRFWRKNGLRRNLWMKIWSGGRGGAHL